jgi:hypothetical protein
MLFTGTAVETQHALVSAQILKDTQGIAGIPFTFLGAAGTVLGQK